MMQERKIDRINVSLVALQVVAIMENLYNRSVFFRRGEEFVIGQQRQLSKTHVHDNDSTRLLAKISEIADFMPISSSTRFTGLFENLAANVVEPTMINTSEPAIFDSPVTQIRSPV